MIKAKLLLGTKINYETIRNKFMEIFLSFQQIKYCKNQNRLQSRQIMIPL